MARQRIFPREKYLSRLRPFYDSDIIKVVTGIRGSGKTCILKAAMDELSSRGIDARRIAYLPLDRRGFRQVRPPEQLEARIESMIPPEGPCHLLIDEAQRVEGFERVALAYAEDGFSVYLSCTQSCRSSQAFTTKLTGRYLEFEIFPLDFREYLGMKEHLHPGALGSLDDEFRSYLQDGGFPETLKLPSAAGRRERVRALASEILKSDARAMRRISNLKAFLKVQSYLLSHCASPLSIQGILKCLAQEGIRAKAQTVRGYVRDLKEAGLIRECRRFDLKRGRMLARSPKIYPADLSLCHLDGPCLGLDRGKALECHVYLYLESCGYEASYCRIGNLECSFICQGGGHSRVYIQVAYSMHGGSRKDDDEIWERACRPFWRIRDGYPRVIISLDKHRDQRYGVRHISAIDLFLGKERI